MYVDELEEILVSLNLQFDEDLLRAFYNNNFNWLSHFDYTPESKYILFRKFNRQKHELCNSSTEEGVCDDV